MLLQVLLDDQVVKTQAMRASPFIKPLEAAATAWEQLLLGAQVTAEQMKAQTLSVEGVSLRGQHQRVKLAKRLSRTKPVCVYSQL